MSLPAAGWFPAHFSCSNAVGLGYIKALLVRGLQPASYPGKQVFATKKKLGKKKMMFEI